MNYQEAIMVLKKVHVFYQNFAVTEERIQDWALVLQEYDLKGIISNLHEHVKTNKFPPTLADLLPKGNDLKVNQTAYRKIGVDSLNIQAEEARAMLELLEGDRFEGVPLQLPNFLKERNKK